MCASVFCKLGKKESASVQCCQASKVECVGVHQRDPRDALAEVGVQGRALVLSLGVRPRALAVLHACVRQWRGRRVNNKKARKPEKGLNRKDDVKLPPPRLL